MTAPTDNKPKHFHPVSSAFYGSQNPFLPRDDSYTSESTSPLPGKTEHHEAPHPSSGIMPTYRKEALTRGFMRLTVGRGAGTMMAAWLGRAVPNAFKYKDPENGNFEYEHNSWYHPLIRRLAKGYDKAYDVGLGKNRSIYEITDAGAEHYGKHAHTRHDVTAEDLLNGWYQPRYYALFEDGYDSPEGHEFRWRKAVVKAWELKRLSPGVEKALEGLDANAITKTHLNTEASHNTAAAELAQKEEEYRKAAVGFLAAGNQEEADRQNGLADKLQEKISFERLTAQSFHKRAENALAKEILTHLSGLDTHSALTQKTLTNFVKDKNITLDNVSFTPLDIEKLTAITYKTRDWSELAAAERLQAVQYWMDNEYRPQGKMKSAGQYWMEISTDFAFMGAADYTVREAIHRVSNVIKHAIHSLDPEWRNSEEAKKFSLAGEIKSFFYNCGENFIRGDGIYDYFVGIFYAPVKEFFSRKRKDPTSASANAKKEAEEFVDQEFKDQNISPDLDKAEANQKIVQWRKTPERKAAIDRKIAEWEKSPEGRESAPLEGSHRLYNIPFDAYNWFGKFLFQDMIIDWWLRPKESRLREYLREHNPGEGVNIFGRVWNAALDIAGFSTMRTYQIFSHMHPAVSVFFTPGRHYAIKAEETIRQARYDAMFETMATDLITFARTQGVNLISKKNIEILENQTSDPEEKKKAINEIKEKIKNLWEGKSNEASYHRTPAYGDKSYQYRQSSMGDFCRDLAQELKTTNPQNVKTDLNAYQGALEKCALKSADTWLHGYIDGKNRPEIEFSIDERDQKTQANLGHDLIQPYTKWHAEGLQKFFYGPLNGLLENWHKLPANSEDVESLRVRSSKTLYMIEQSESAASRFPGYATYFAAKDILDAESMNNPLWNKPVRWMNRALFSLKAKPKDWKEQLAKREVDEYTAKPRGEGMSIGFDGQMVGSMSMENMRQQMFVQMSAMIDEKMAEYRITGESAHQQAEQALKAVLAQMQGPEQVKWAQEHKHEIVDQALTATLSKEQRERVVMEAPLKQ